MAEINWLAAIVAGILGFFPGGLWYSKLMFLNVWMADSGIAAEDCKKHAPGKQIGAGVVLSLIAALIFAYLIGERPPLDRAFIAGLGVGLFITAAFGIQYLFEGKNLRLAAINGGYHIVQFAIFGLVLGSWH
jgi:hypothetical protein